eukprot:8197-Pleurochrysis_carterae.AAC.2
MIEHAAGTAAATADVAALTVNAAAVALTTSGAARAHARRLAVGALLLHECARRRLPVRTVQTVGLFGMRVRRIEVRLGQRLSVRPPLRQNVSAHPHQRALEVKSVGAMRERAIAFESLAQIVCVATVYDMLFGACNALATARCHRPRCEAECRPLGGNTRAERAQLGARDWDRRRLAHESAEQKGEREEDHRDEWREGRAETLGDDAAEAGAEDEAGANRRTEPHQVAHACRRRRAIGDERACGSHRLLEEANRHPADEQQRERADRAHGRSEAR